MAAHDVLGRPIASQGKILFHEHLQFGWPGFQLDPGALRTSDVAHAVATLDQLADAGYSVLVDATPMECGRDLAWLRAVAERTRVQVIACAGLYEQTRGFPTHFAGLSVEDLADLFTGEIGGADKGIGRAGALKVATRPVPFSQREQRAVQAAGRVSAALGVPIITHAGSIETASAQLAMLTEAGADPRRVVLGHLDSVPDGVAGITDLAQAGAFIGIDRFGHTEHGADERRIELLQDLRRQGVLSSVLISHDAPLTFLGRLTVGQPGRNPFLHIEHAVTPALQRAGFSDAELRLLLAENPRRLLTW